MCLSVTGNLNGVYIWNLEFTFGVPFNGRFLKKTLPYVSLWQFQEQFSDPLQSFPSHQFLRGAQCYVHFLCHFRLFQFLHLFEFQAVPPGLFLGIQPCLTTIQTTNILMSWGNIRKVLKKLFKSSEVSNNTW